MSGIIGLAASIGIGGIIGISVSAFAVLLLISIIVIAKRYKRCPSDKILVISGKTRKNKDGSANFAMCIHGGAKFVWPVIQEYAFLDLTPMPIIVELRAALSKQNIRVDVPCRFTVGISTEPGVMQNAAERLRCRSIQEIQDLAREMIMGQMRLVVANMCIEEINSDRDMFLSEITANVETEIRKVGLKLFNVNVTDITDESGYIVALGREAAATAINDARVKVADAERKGAVGEAEALKEKRIQVANAESLAIDGENKAQADIAASQALLREKQAEALKRAVAAEKIQEAKALQESYQAQKTAEQERAAREKATQEADIIVKTEIEKRRIELEAEAEAERIRRHAKGEADAIKAMRFAEGEGIFAVLSKQAEGFKQIVNASGNSPEKAVQMMIADKIEALISSQVEAIKNIKIDSVTVWDSGAGSNGEGSSTANFLSNMGKSLPPLRDLLNMTGLELPEFLAKPITATDSNNKAKTVEVKSEKPTKQKDTKVAE
ncbi:MAG: SPFH domain-containing protein [Firmicutes bacterium]|nr:SPFH domain-containing protein [Bacillota bacterium]